MIITNSNHVTIGGDGRDDPKGVASVSLFLNATKAGGAKDHYKVGLRTESTSSGPGSKGLSVETRSETGQIDKYTVKLGVGDWVGDKDDAEDIDFLICFSGTKWKPEQAPMLSDEQAKDLDFRCDINLSGLGVNAKVKNALTKDLKKVKCVDGNGEEAWGYLGTAEDAQELLKVSFTSAKTGDEIAKLCLDISSDTNKGPVIPDIFQDL